MAKRQQFDSQQGPRKNQKYELEEDDDILDLEEPMLVDDEGKEHINTVLYTREPVSSDFVKSTDAMKQTSSTTADEIVVGIGDNGIPLPTPLLSHQKTCQPKRNSSGQCHLRPRSYQLELASEAIEGKNVIICAPTGSGKTFTAALVCQKVAEKKNSESPGNGSSFKALFVVCIRALVDQQCRALQRFLSNVGRLEQSQFLDEALNIYDVVVLTAQTVVNALRNREIDLEKLSLVIIDECHHADLNHPYNELMRIYHQRKIDGSSKLPQILGLTASLGAGSGTDIKAAEEHYVRICANLDCQFISYIRNAENLKELETHNPRPSPNQIMQMAERPKDSEFYKILTEFMEKIEAEYNLSTAVAGASKGTQEYEGVLSNTKKEAETQEERCEEMVACDVLTKINSAWRMQNELRAKDALNVLDKYVEDNLKGKPGQIERKLCEWYGDTRKKLVGIVSGEEINDWPLLMRLHNLVKELFEEDKKSQGIIMTSTIQSVDGILGFLKDHPPFESLIPGKFVGHRQKIENSMTEKEQEKALEDFRLGIVNLLVATDVAQEGLDIPDCNFVIRYNFVSNEIGSVQSQGRARARDSKCFLIAYENSVNVDREMKNLTRERWMQEALETINSPQMTGELQQRIRRRQEALYEQLRSRAMDTENAAKDGSGGECLHSIHCKRCKAFLCLANHVVKYNGHFICTDDQFTSRVDTEPDPKPKDFKYDSVSELTTCKNCKARIGAVIQYKRGGRIVGYVLGKDSIMWKKAGEERYGAIKKWENAPFTIQTKGLSD